MKFRLIILAITLFIATAVCAQKNSTSINPFLDGRATITGNIIDSDTGAPVLQAAIQLFALPDTTAVTGTVSNNSGYYSIPKLSVGKYLLRYTFLGYVTQDKQIEVVRSDRTKELGTIKLKPDTIMLSEAVVQSELPQMQIVDDTIMFNADAYRVPEGSVLEELIKRLPGVTVDDGVIKVNGKTVRRFLVDGKEFFDYDTDMAMKNLPTEMVEKVKTYERKSDLARVTGIDDGEEEMVMDIQVKPKMRRGWITNMDWGAGIPVGDNDYGEWIKALYSGRLTINRFHTREQLSITANTGNLSGYGGRGGRGGGAGNGLNYNSQVGVNFSRTIGKAYKGRRNEYPLEIGGNVRYNGSNSRSINESESETYLTSQTSQSFRNNHSSNRNYRDGIDGGLRLEWRPDTMTDIMFRPSFSINSNGNGSSSESVSFNADPHQNGMDEPLSQYREDRFRQLMDSIGVNSQTNSSASNGTSMQFSGQIQVNRKFNSKGRNLTFSTNFSFSRNNNENFSVNRQKYYQTPERDTIMNRYNDSPSKNNNVSGRLMWSEPFSDYVFLQLSYQAQYRFQDTDRKTYQFPSYKEPFNKWGENWDLPDPEMMVFYENDSLSRYQTYENFDQTIETQLRLNTEKITMNVGFSLMPQHQSMKYKFMGIDTLASRSIFNWTPTLNFRYRWTRQTSLQVTYRGRTNQPSMDQMLAITDNSNPLNIRKGNPELLPTFNNTLELNYQHGNQEKQRNYSFRVSGSNTLRNISSRTEYDERTGVTTTQSVNMEGFWSNWNTSADFTFSSAIGLGKLPDDNRINMSTSTSASYSHQEGYMRSRSGMGGSQGSQLSTTRSFNANERLNASYRNNWLEVSANGNIRFQHSRNSLQTNNNTATWNYSYGVNVDLRKSKWKNLRLNTDISMQSRRGFSSAAYNRNDLIWNMQLSVNVFKKNAGTISLQWLDILNQTSNINRSISATGRSDTKNNNINSYIVLHFIYRLNIFGNKEARKEMRQARHNVTPEQTRNREAMNRRPQSMQNVNRPQGMGNGRPGVMQGMGGTRPEGTQGTRSGSIGRHPGGNGSPSGTAGESGNSR